jgi:NTE family protein
MVYGVIPMSVSKIKKNKSQYKYIACAFQGGGALGAYQAGVLHALDEAGYYPNWFVGTSIGAINAALAAGNPEKIRVEKMYQFWDAIATPNIMPHFDIEEDSAMRQIEHLLSAHSALFFGQPGFFAPRFPYPEFSTQHRADLISYYDTSPLRSTLERFVDFDRINSKKVTRLSLGAVEVCSGQMIYFDSHKEKIGPEHIMASGALPPSFPAVEVNGKFYWDGGISNNTPICYVLGNQEEKHVLCFMVNLFNSYGLDPTSLDEILKRKKDIEFSSKYNKILKLYQQIQELKNSIHLLSHYVPQEERSKPELKLCLSRGHESTISLVHFLYQEDCTELSSKDYEFSHKTIKERIAKGYHDGRKAVKSAPWLQPVSATEGIAIHEMAPIKTFKKEKK